jgi:ferredoxin-NADP reductase
VLRVESSQFVADDVLLLKLAGEGSSELPSWTPGSHLLLTLPSGRQRAYSLCGDPNDRTSYEIAVLRERDGRGGSAEIHAGVAIGTGLHATEPINAFELVDAKHYVFIAGGIGITPLLPMLKEVTTRMDATWEIHYLGRKVGSMAFLDQVLAFAGRETGRVSTFVAAQGKRFNARATLTSAPLGAAIFCCGPERLLSEVETVHREVGRGQTLRMERFARAALVQASQTEYDLDHGVTATPCDPDGSFDVVLARSGVTVRVEAGKSILQAVRQIRREFQFSCSNGYCGTCEVRVLAGVPDHRDQVLTGDEKAGNKSMMICVGRSCTSQLVLDL